MSEHDVPHPGDPFARANQNRTELAARYPDQFSGENVSLTWPDGWHALVVGVCACADASRIPVRWHQIKQKFGELRMYTQGCSMPADISVHESGRAVGPAPEVRRGNASLGARIKEAEEASRWTCCLCGASDAAAHVKRRASDEWSFTACDACTPKIRAYHAWSVRQS